MLTVKRPKIFLCHSSRDKTFVRDLATRLDVDGVDTWLDEVEIHVGESIHQKVNDGLQQSDFFAIVLSRASVTSKWVQNELSSASALEKYSERGIFILPILIETCDVPALLLDRRYANFKDDPESAYQELLDSIRHYFESKVPAVDVSGVNVAEPTEATISNLALDPSSLHLLPPRHFEQVVAQLIEHAGFTVELTPLTRDGGYDIIAYRDFGLPNVKPSRYIVECKRYRRPIDALDVQRLADVTRSQRADRALFVTTSQFTRNAQQAGREHGVELVDYAALQEWLKKFRKAAG